MDAITINLNGIGKPADRLDCPTDDDAEDVITERGRQAWERLKTTRDFDDWVLVGHAHVILRAKAMRTANTNGPTGKLYNKAFKAELELHGFDGIDKHDRADLFELMGHLDEIQAWLETVPLTNRRRYNHPRTIMRKWNKKDKPKPDNDDKLSPWAKNKQALAQVQDDNARLVLENQRLKLQAASRIEWDDTPDDDPAPTKTIPAVARRDDEVIEAEVGKVEKQGKEPDLDIEQLQPLEAIGLGILLRDKSSHPGVAYRQWFEDQHGRAFSEADALALRELADKLTHTPEQLDDEDDDEDADYRTDDYVIRRRDEDGNVVKDEKGNDVLDGYAMTEDDGSISVYDLDGNIQLKLERE